MTNQTDYFNRKGYQGKYHIGDRVFGHYQKIPFVGSVGNDRMIDGVHAEVTIHLDLPMKTKDGVRSIIIVKHRDIKRLTDHETETTRVHRKSSKG